MPVSWDRHFYRSVTFMLLLSLAGWSALGLGAFYFYTHKSLPQTRGETRPVGLQAPGLIIRDKFGIPHCYAENQNDLFYLAGYAQAQDRLFQMDLFRRTAAGRMAEWKGSPALGQDRLARAIGFSRLAAEQYQKLPPESKAVLDAFAAGVNAYAFSGAQSLPVEYPPLHAKFEPWKPEDSLAVYLYFVYCASDWPRSLIKQALWDVDEKAKRFQLLVLTDQLDLSYGEEFKIDPEWVKLLLIDRQLRNGIGSARFATGVALRKMIKGRETASLGMNVQGPMSLPSTWYLTHYSSPEMDIAGAVIPGFPMIFSGSNRKVSFVSWFDASNYLAIVGMTSEGKDCTAASEPNYINETIKYMTDKGMVAETMKFRPSMMSDILSDIHMPPGLYLEWRGALVKDPVKLLLDLSLANNEGNLTTHLEEIRDPIMIAYATLAAQIGSVHPHWGLPSSYPCCQEPCGIGGGAYSTTPSSEAKRMNTCQDCDGHSLPCQTKVVIDESKFFCADDYCVTKGLYPAFSLFSQKYMRLINMVDAYPDEPLKVLRDTRLNFMEYTEPLMGVLEKYRHNDNDLERVYRQMKDWNGEFDINLSAPLIYSETLRQAMILAYQDDVSPDLLPWLLELDYINTSFLVDLQDPKFEIFDDRRTPKVETRDDILLKAFKIAIANLTKQYGPRMTQWKWGEAHRLKLRHPLGDEHLGSVLRYFTLARPSPPMPGGRDTIWNGYYNWSGDYSMTAGTSLMLVMDMARPDELCVAYAGGQSGQPFSPHYVDLLQYWLRGECAPVALDRATVEREAESTLRLLPRGGKDSR